MSSNNRRRGWIVSIVAVGALLVALTPATQAQAQQDRTGAKSRLSQAGPFGPDRARGAVKSKSKAADDPTPIDSVCKVTGYTPTSVTIGSAAIKKNFKPTVTGCTLKYYQVWVLPFVSDDDTNYDGISWQDSPAAVLDPHYLINSWAGTQKEAVAVLAWGEEDPTEDENYDVQPAEAYFDVTILRNSSFSSSFDATPEPVKKGGKLTIKGTLKRINLDQATKLGYIGYPKAPVQIQFQASGSSTWTTVNTQKAGPGGTISTRVVASQTGNWRLYFPGNGVTGAATSAVDAVKVS